jgi:LmbE family N-acetylglucosaminyl deacetylase/SAM-dependent methyltransferase
VVTFSHADTGTAGDAWAASGLSAAPQLPLDTAGAALHLVVLAAHPDDETLGAGGLVASALAAGAAVDVILCTAGEGSHPDSPTHTPEQLAAVRLEEFAAALAALGLGHGQWHFLALPDRGLGAHAAAIAGAVRKVVRRRQENPGQVVLVAPYREDGHADHDALGAVAADVAGEDGHGLLEYPIWYWHWAGTGHPAWQDWVRYPLDPPARAAKGSAMAAHASQVRPLSPAPGDEVLLSGRFLEHFSRGYEVFAWTPPRGRPQEAHRSADAERIFDRVHGQSDDPWNYTSSWYERRKRALTLAALPAESYAAGLEVGCSIGTLTADLSDRCSSLLAVDASGIAAGRAAARLAGSPHVSVRQMVVPGAWPEGLFDLVVVSEVGYYLAPDELSVLWDRISGVLQPGGTLVLCHWRHPVEGWLLDGEAVHGSAREGSRWQSSGLYRERDFILEVFAADGADAGAGAGRG